MGNRYIKDLVINIDPTTVEISIQKYLTGNNFKPAFDKGEHYYKAGGMMSPLRGFKYSYENGILHVEAWNGKIGKEMNIGDGKLLGAAAKIPYYNSILALLKAFDNIQPEYRQTQDHTLSINQSLSNGQMQNPVPTQQSAAAQQISSTVDYEINKSNNRNALISFWLSIGTLVLLLLSRYSLLFNIASLTLAINNGLKSQKKGFAIAAIVINSVAIFITIIWLVLILLLS